MNEQSVKQMPDISERRVVTTNECDTFLRMIGWQEKTIELLYRGGFPKEIQSGSILLIVK